MDADPAAAPATGDPDLWAACEERAVVRLTLAGGQRLTGRYTSRVGLHFLHRTGRDMPLIGEITGPYGPGDVLAVEVVRTRAQVLEDAHVRLHGKRVPGREPVTRAAPALPAVRRLRAHDGRLAPRPTRRAAGPVLPPRLTPTRLVPDSPGASLAGVGHPGRRDACLFLPTPARRPCRTGLACFRRVQC